VENVSSGNVLVDNIVKHDDYIDCGVYVIHYVEQYHKFETVLEIKADSDDNGKRFSASAFRQAMARKIISGSAKGERDTLC